MQKYAPQIFLTVFIFSYILCIGYTNDLFQEGISQKTLNRVFLGVCLHIIAYINYIRATDKFNPTLMYIIVPLLSLAYITFLLVIIVQNYSLGVLDTDFKFRDFLNGIVLFFSMGTFLYILVNKGLKKVLS